MRSPAPASLRTQQNAPGPGQGQGVSCRVHQEDFLEAGQVIPVLASSLKKKFFRGHTHTRAVSNPLFTYHNKSPYLSHTRVRFFFFLLKEKKFTSRFHNLKKRELFFKERRMWKGRNCFYPRSAPIFYKSQKKIFKKTIN